MSWSTEVEASASEHTVSPRQGEGSAHIARSFANDSGELAIETRRVLVQLLLGPAVDSQRQTKLWPVLVRDERVIRARLHELFLDLVIDHDQQVAYTRQVVDPELEIPVLLRRASLTMLQSALLLYLREQLILAEARGERAVVSRDEMQEHLAAYQPADSRDQAKFTKQTAGAVERADKLNLLRKLRGADERYEISPALKLLFSAEEILALTGVYQRIAEGGGVGFDEDRDSAERSGEP
jgi:hypothetical protein